MAGFWILVGAMWRDEHSGNGSCGRVVLEQGPPAEVLGSPQKARTRQFLDRVLNPL